MGDEFFSEQPSKQKATCETSYQLTRDFNLTESERRSTKNFDFASRDYYYNNKTLQENSSMCDISE